MLSPLASIGIQSLDPNLKMPDSDRNKISVQKRHFNGVCWSMARVTDIGPALAAGNDFSN